MARKSSNVPLNVFINARLVGCLRRELSGAIVFQYDEGWLNWENAFAISLSLPIREERYVGEQVFAVFDNLLPDNEEIRSRVAARSNAEGIDPYSLLAAIGRDCVGALQFLPDDMAPDKAGEIKADPINDDQIAKMLTSLKSSPLGIGEDIEFRISIAGAQDKTALLRIDDHWNIPHGTSPTTHILKPQIGQRYDYDLMRSVENEYLCLNILRHLGLPVAKTEILDFNGVRALVVERFDRHWTKDGRLLRRAQEDCCQALSCPPSRKYQADGGPNMGAIFELLKGSDDPAHDQLIFMKSQIAFWVLGATDGHAKNFSLFLHPRGGFQLTPFYDVMSAQPWLDNHSLKHKSMKLAMSVGNNNHYRVDKVHPRHFQQVALRAGLAEGMVETALSQIREAMPDAVEKARSELPKDFSMNIYDSIAKAALKRNEIISL